MSHFYGTIEGTRGKGTRCGSKASGLTVHAASWDGAVRVQLLHDAATGKDMAEVSLIPWRGRGATHMLYAGPVNPAEGLKAVGLYRTTDDGVPVVPLEASHCPSLRAREEGAKT